MDKSRRYIACWDDGRAKGDFEFKSESRANSTGNYVDAKSEAYRKYGKRSRQMNITQTYLLKE